MYPVIGCSVPPVGRTVLPIQVDVKSQSPKLSATICYLSSGSPILYIVSYMSVKPVKQWLMTDKILPI